MSPLYDYQCTDCQRMIEEFAAVNEVGVKPCPVCGHDMRRLVSYGAGSVQGESPAWIESIKDVIAKDTKDPTARAFLADPTRTNLNRWKKANNLRHLEAGEEYSQRTSQREREAEFERSSVENAMRRLQERRRIEV